MKGKCQNKNQKTQNKTKPTNRKYPAMSKKSLLMSNNRKYILYLIFFFLKCLWYFEEEWQRRGTDRRGCCQPRKMLKSGITGRGRSSHLEHRGFVTEVLKLLFYLGARGIRLGMSDPQYKFTRGCWVHQNLQMMSFLLLTMSIVQDTLFWDNGTQEADVMVRRWFRDLGIRAKDG